MSDPMDASHRIECYLRDQMRPDELARFETELLDSPVLQQELETALGLRAVLASGSDGTGGEPRERLADSQPRSPAWRQLALAAAVVFAAFSSLIFWRVSHDAEDLQRQLDLLGQPRTEVLVVPVDIMRSGGPVAGAMAGRRSPDVIVRKPAGHAAIVLDIELSPAASRQESLRFALLDESGTPVLAWAAVPGAAGRVTVSLNAEQVPAGRLWLETHGAGTRPLERRLLEFRSGQDRATEP